MSTDEEKRPVGNAMTDYEAIYQKVLEGSQSVYDQACHEAGLAAVVAAAKAVAFGDAVDWARSQSGGSADVAADYIELAAAIQEQDKEITA